MLTNNQVLLKTENNVMRQDRDRDWRLTTLSARVHQYF